MRLRFLGAAGTVTGSRTLVTTDGQGVLVDCGMFQGFKQNRLRNWQPLGVEVADLAAVVLTHAHLDHSGWLPALVRDGFGGPIYCTPGTADLLGVLLPDSGRIQEEDAAYANRKGYSKHDPALPMYTEKDAFRALERLRPISWNSRVDIAGLTARFVPAGHILGASSVQLSDHGTSVVFSGDLGRPDDLLMRAPASPPPSDFVVMESTYGGRQHGDGDLLAELGAITKRTLDRGGTVVIPSFAVGRAQAVLWALQMLREQGEIPDVPVFLDSPMAINTTELYLRHHAELRLDAAQIARMCDNVTFVRSVEESKELNFRPGPQVIVAASGMLTGGRVLHHLQHRAGGKDNLLLFVGYQAPGSRGAKLVAGEQHIKVHGQGVRVRCTVARIDGFSAHADHSELVDWLRTLPSKPKRVWLNHGEPEAIEALRVAIQDELDLDVAVAVEGATFDLQGGGVLPPGAHARPEESGDALLRSPAYKRADRDLAFLDRDDMRSVRLMLEYLKVEKSMTEQGITGTIVVFGSTRICEAAEGATPEISERLHARAAYYEVARSFGRIVGEHGRLNNEPVVVMTGGGGGIMEAANRGAHEAGAQTAGLNITLPREQRPNRWISPELCFQFRYFAIRKMHFLWRARALVAFPGGYGTFDEIFDALCLIQTGKLPPIPIVLVGKEFWDEVFHRQWLADEGLIDPADAELVTVVDTAEEAWEAIARRYGE